MKNEYERSIPLPKVISAAIMDTYEDMGKVYQMYAHWAARGVRKLHGESLKIGKRYALIPVNHNTHTAPLPCDFGEEIFVGVVNKVGAKIALRTNSNLANSINVVDESEKKCNKCGQLNDICNDLSLEEETELIAINDQVYERREIKKLYPNGDYYSEITTPVLDIETDEVSFITEKKFVVNLAKKDCGCIDDSSGNVEKIKVFCPDVYYKYFSPCDCSYPAVYGGYKIFEENGFIQLDRAENIDKIYLEYWGTLPKKNGQYYIPEIAFETLVEWVKFKSIQNKKSVPLSERDYQFKHYMRERGNMERRLGRTSLSLILQFINSTPKLYLD